MVMVAEAGDRDVRRGVPRTQDELDVALEELDQVSLTLEDRLSEVLRPGSASLGGWYEWVDQLTPVSNDSPVTERLVCQVARVRRVTAMLTRVVERVDF